MNKIKKNIVLLISSKSISNLGNLFFDYGNNTWIASLGKKGQKILTYYQISESIIGIIFNIFGGIIADKRNKKRTIIIADISSCIVCFILALCYPTVFFIYIMILVNALLAVFSSLKSPSYKSIIPNIVDKKNLKNTNSLLEISNQLINISSPIFLIVFMKVIGIQGALFIDSISFLISAIINYNISMLNPISNEKKDSKKIKVIEELKIGLNYLIKDPNLINLLIVSAIVNLFLAGYNFSIPFSKTAFDTTDNTYGTLLTAQAIGGILGGIFSRKYIKNSSMDYLLKILLFCGLGIMLIYISFLLTKNLFAIASCVALFHFLLTIYNVTFFTNVQLEVNKEYLGRVFSVIFTISIVFMPIGTLLFSIFLSASNPFNYIVVGLGIVITSTTFLLINKKRWTK
nr:MFS transporter [Enterococcus sp. DIV2402]MBO0463843.1 MFS transporter [Enterococcus sp. DIV2402]